MVTEGKSVWALWGERLKGGITTGHEKTFGTVDIIFVKGFKTL